MKSSDLRTQRTSVVGVCQKMNITNIYDLAVATNFAMLF